MKTKNTQSRWSRNDSHLASATVTTIICIIKALRITGEAPIVILGECHWSNENNPFKMRQYIDKEKNKMDSLSVKIVAIRYKNNNKYSRKHLHNSDLTSWRLWSLWNGSRNGINTTIPSPWGCPNNISVNNQRLLFDHKETQRSSHRITIPSESEWNKTLQTVFEEFAYTRVSLVKNPKWFQKWSDHGYHIPRPKPRRK